jgi:alginate O-acetyltransferase complex protein AlgI
MVFSSPSFLYYFLPITIFCYFLVGIINRDNVEYKNFVLLFFSLTFYFYGAGQYTILLLAITVSSYVFGILIEKSKRKRLLFLFSISFPLFLLFVFKYTNFFMSQAVSLAANFGIPFIIPKTNIILPIGISFYTFQCLSYIIDIYLKKEKPERNFFDLLLYISMFPQLIAGPIVRYKTIAKQLHNRTTSLNDFSVGAARFMYGLSKKVIIADACGLVADTAYGVPLEIVSTPVAVIGSFAYFLQIYFDFSAYSDMAIGLGKLFGFHFPENFYRPYSSSSITDFWKRWHITLSSWFRDYLYIPIGGSRKGRCGTYLNLWIVFLCTGIWHGANWTFLLWGIYHGTLLSIERFFNLRKHECFEILWRIITIILIYFGWIIFRSESLDQAFVFYSHIFYPRNWELVESVYNILTNKNVFIMLVAFSTLFFPKNFVMGKIFENVNCSITELLVKNLALIAIMAYSICIIASGNYSPFIYFQF